ncbi:MAG: YggS family pyridoxal phosphate-dependent enzyme [Candidatus Electryonea clarkiae]|nr:YggS family pyridoxal phosphate-dependent enzyme [Candidatus Electryonea clarkiae]MDP8289308.1 YggS family pyridoxal phosphate-dependent enzyme [Candidatus Electryonea clarkiae]
MMKISIAENLASIKDRIVKAEHKAGREPGSVELMAVSKTMPVANVVAAFNAGQMLFGENRFQGTPEKIADVADSIRDKAGRIRWHYIGHVQSNKIRKIFPDFELLHGLDNEKLIIKIDRVAEELGIIAHGLLQINVSGTVTQFGLNPMRAIETAEKVAGLKNIRIEGLMAIGPMTDDEYLLRRAFERVRIESEKIAELKLENVEMKTLSMGMSGDFEIAIEEGSTLVRVGTSIFGERNK